MNNAVVLREEVELGPLIMTARWDNELASVIDDVHAERKARLQQSVRLLHPHL